MKIQKKIKNFVSKVLDNRILDLYMKYKGITMLTTATLVPVALILGSNMFKKYIKNDVKTNQKGGFVLKELKDLIDYKYLSFIQNKIPNHFN